MNFKKNQLNLDGNNINSVYPQGDEEALQIGADSLTDTLNKITATVKSGTEVAKSGVEIYNQLNPVTKQLTPVVVPISAPVVKNKFPTWGYFVIGGSAVAISIIVILAAKSGK